MHKVKVSIITSLFRCEKYLVAFLNHLERISNVEECEIILVHNDPSEAELNILANFRNPGIEIEHIKVTREPLYSSWNRAIHKSKGEFLTIWNVDDVRLPTAIEDQKVALDNNKEAAIVYGDFTVVNEYGSTTGLRVTAPRFSRYDKSFFRNHHIGPFPMWRRNLHDSIGYFDEQFKLVADLDFQIRSAQKFQLLKLNKHLGYYLEGTAGNLSSNFSLQEVERTALHLRYSNYDLIFLTHLLSLDQIKVFNYKWFGKYHPVEEWSHTQSIKKVKNLPLLFFSIIRLPKHLAQKSIRTLRKYSGQYSLTFLSKRNTKPLI
ncbi:glycosyltransferase [Pontibacter amylolyticus]|uniref:Glycosyltransferase 2-like domain-containing protein n=1 Tax=Pontibacter amylolyticus TaxID=1424080 RepID=A0ABQ1W3V4_9BACT|nr:glycosyltransferase [Pontibacter amylolyticus]GGG12485.1 hypothetical protein GCM10011323_16160 [Pontibacter amylolyticus]